MTDCVRSEDRNLLVKSMQHRLAHFSLPVVASENQLLYVLTLKNALVTLVPLGPLEGASKNGVSANLF